jgi:methionine synthase II (cobalamin-independent)
LLGEELHSLTPFLKESLCQHDIARITSAAFFDRRKLLQARSAKVTAVELRRLEDKHILEVLERQKQLDFKIFTDGELRRINFMSDFNDAVEGINESDNLLRAWQASASGTGTQAARVPGIVVGKIKQTRRLNGA